MISVRIDDLAFFDGEAIVRPVNEDLGATTPLLRRLELAAGTELYNQIRLQEPLPVGAAVVTCKVVRCTRRLASSSVAVTR